MSRDLKRSAVEIFRKTLAAIDLRSAIARKVERTGPLLRIGSFATNLNLYKEIVVVAMGKAAYGMADAITDILAPEYPTDGILVVPAGPVCQIARWKTFVGGHPTPNEGSFAAGKAILDRLATCDEKTLIIFLLSGGGSSLVEQPLDRAATLEDFRTLNQVIVGCGAAIEEINVIRKHVSAIKGGRLAAAAPKSTKITLAVSDVPAGMESALASGPTLPDPTTWADVQRVIQEYGLANKLPIRIRQTIDACAFSETPKAGDPALLEAHFVLVLGPHDLMHAAHHACEAEGFQCVCDWSTDSWPLQRAADQLLGMVDQQKASNPGHCVAVVADGEVSSPVTGQGIGGRNSAFVLTCVPKIADKKAAILSVGTDGIDGNSPAAGAVADGATFAAATDEGMDSADFLRRSDAYSFFKALGDAIETGPTGINVRDLRILLAEAD